MKRYKILFFLLLLCSIQPSWACINDPEDWNNYEGDFENCIDGDELDEVVCTPNHDDDDDDDGFSFDDDDDDDDTIGSNVNGDEGWWDDDDDDQLDDDDEDDVHFYNQNIHHPKPGEVDLKCDEWGYVLPERWHKQEIIRECTLVVMEYLSNYFKDTLFEGYSSDRHTFADGYIDLYGHDGSLDGVYYSELLALLGYEGFRYMEIGCDDIIANINDDNPVMVTVADGTHELMIIGYEDDDTFYAVNPATGTIQVWDADEFTNCIAVTGYRVYD